jgi:hypothetical protein
MANPTLSAAVAAAFAAGVGAALGVWLSLPAREATPPGAAAVETGVLAEVRELRRELATRLPPSPVATQGPAEGLPRDVVATAPSTVDAMLVQRLEQVLQRLAALETRHGNDELTQARTQNPQPNLAAVQVLWQRLTDARNADDADGRREVARELWLYSMAEVVRRFGTPSNIYTTGATGRCTLEYLLDKHRCLTILLQDGVVVSVSD